MKSRFLERAQEKVIVADGAMGTMIQERDLTPEDFRGLDGCNEYLVECRPDVIRDIHAAYFEAGSDIVETNSFGSSEVVLAEYDIAAKTYELSKKSAELARSAADEIATPNFPRFVAGSVGPTTKLASLGHIRFDELSDSYLPHMVGLLDGGIDLFMIETCQDVLQIKCAVITARKAMQKVGREVPISVTFTVETTGTMLVGTEVSAALTVIESLPVDILGLNCATGPDLMQENIKFLGSSSSRMVAVLPNAGLPRNVGGRAVYDLTPEELGSYHETFVKKYGASFVGGCCGTTAAHIREIARRVGSLEPMRRSPRFEEQVSSIFTAVPLDQSGSSPLIVGERCNANGSKLFREHLLAENWDAMVQMGRDEMEHGAHVLDVCTAYVGRNEVRDMTEVLSRFATQVNGPIMIDSTQLDVLEAGLKLMGGRSIINSINLEDGEERFDRVCELANRYGAALVALTIDESGMAKDAQAKLDVAKRIHDLCVNRHGISPGSLIFDPLTFTIASGDEDSRKAGIATLDGIRMIKESLPGVRTILGLSNISFGLKPYPRQLLNSVYLAEAIKSGLDSCIVHNKKILPIHKIEPEILEITMDLIYDRRREGYDPLFKFIEKLQGTSAERVDDSAADAGPIEERLKKRIIDGKKIGIEVVLDEARETYKPLEIINTILLEGMKTVGELFGSGQMQLPFVLQSAETMKRAVSHLEQYMEKIAGSEKGCLVIATVKGDVHDIGKNLVDIILSNNGYKVVNLGIKQPLESIMSAFEEHKPTAIGMSGLLVKSTVVMKENLELMSERGVTVPVICGGAALNRAYVEYDLRKAYTTGPVFYGEDAFTGLQIMDELTDQVTEKKITTNVDEARRRRGEMRAEREERVAERAQEYVKTDTAVLDEVPVPPFWGVQYVEPEQIDLREVFKFINKKALYVNQWMYRRGTKSTREYRAFIDDHVEGIFEHWKARTLESGWIQPKVAYGYFPCQSDKNHLVLYDPVDHELERCRISFPRQIADKRRCIADYFLPVESGRLDVVEFQVVTSGAIASEKCMELFKSDNYTDYLHFYGLSVETAEAMAEYWHKQVRTALGIAGSDDENMEAIFRQKYHGERYSFGYPACPNVEDQKYIFELLHPEKIGVTLSEEYQLNPEQSTSAIVVHHPEACYYSI